ncbi:hypothetical protein [Georgenia yuyongxinii]|uniref:Phosphodiester glycosidase domain-containing protein n=1 Tax=Georgenia yuyongxinii TaxID=2589797 RepID=A0A552WV66_9MICO|nr:hypothetical protein [Georgenia yuyongxinii]TRW46731.1 hypothetical protein FJ693_04370 [Georgenia yuyongxinii]
MLVVLALLLLVPLGSYAQALTYPGSASVLVRTVDWVSDHGGRGAINAVENWMYTHHGPPRGDASTAPRPQPPAATAGPIGPAGPVAPTMPGPALAPPPGHPALPGEGAWTAGRTSSSGQPDVYTTFVRPDPLHPGVVVGVARFASSRTAVHLVGGTREPGGIWPGGARVPSADVPHLVATFNSGWRTGDQPGGFFLDGRGADTLVAGRASAVIDDAGHVTVGQWGRDVTMSPHVRAVRQNLKLVVDGGAPVPGLGTNADGSWGSPRNQYQFTWRSGLGTDAHGDLVYVVGNNLTLQTLAQALVVAGVQRGMELDIHSQHISFTAWYGTATQAQPRLLLPDMSAQPLRYLTPDQRDFFYVTQE